VVQPAQVTAEKLQQLVSSVALYPDELVAQVLAGCHYPTEIVEREPLAARKFQSQGRPMADAVINNPGILA